MPFESPKKFQKPKGDYTSQRSMEVKKGLEAMMGLYTFPKILLKAGQNSKNRTKRE